MSASPRSSGADQLRQLRRVVLPVSVQPHRQLVPMLDRVLEAGLNGSADPQVEREAQHDRSGRGGELGRLVGRPVVDHEHVEARIEVADLAHDVADRALLVPGGDDRDPARLSHGLQRAPRDRPEPAAAWHGAHTCARRARVRGRGRPSPRPAPGRRAGRGRRRAPRRRHGRRSAPGPARTSARSPRRGWRRSRRRRRRARTAGTTRSPQRSRASAA